MPDEDRDPVARLTVTHPLIAGTGYLWGPIVVAMADALCAFGVSHHWPDGALELHHRRLLGQLHLERPGGRAGHGHRGRRCISGARRRSGTPP